MAIEVVKSSPESSREVGFIGAFKRYGFVLVAVPAIVVATVVGAVVYNVMVHDFGSVFAAGTSGTIAEAYDAETFRHDPTSREYSHLAEMVARRITSGRLTAIRVQDVDGRVVFSTDSTEVGTIVPFGDTETAAIEQRRVDSYVTDDDPLTPADSGTSLVVIVPVELQGASEVLGVTTAFKPFDSVYPGIRNALASIVGTVLLGAMVSYSLLRLLVFRSERQLRESQQATEQVSQRLGDSLSELELTYLGTLQALNAAVDAKDSYTARHSLHVADYACALGLRLEMDDTITSLERAGLLHDIGKIGVAELILQKPTGLTEEEYAAVCEHSVIGATMVETVPFLADIVPAIRHHHERWDGTGYPEGLAAEQTPVLARILAIADAFDAMTTTRPYRPPMSLAAARAELMRCRGTQFDPRLTDIFIEMIDDGIIIRNDA